MKLPVFDFIRQRLAEVDPSLDTRTGTAFSDLFINPHQAMMQPFGEELDYYRIAQSPRLILALDDPNSFPEDAVDDILSRVFLERDPGEKSFGVARAYYREPVSVEFPALTAEFLAGSLSFFNVNAISITAQAMSLQTEAGFYYLDIPIVAQKEGSEYAIPAGSITTFVNDNRAVRVTNLAAISGGRSRETNVEALQRAQESIGTRDLETIKGINGTLREKFPFIRSIQTIGMGDQEMMRDVRFNTHVGGNTDVYIKLPSLTTKSDNFVGLDYDMTRVLPRNVKRMMARSVNDEVYSADMNTPKIQPDSVRVTEDLTETVASMKTAILTPGSGINLSGGLDYIWLSIDNGPAKRIKVSGTLPANTQRYEILNAINNAYGYEIAFNTLDNRIQIFGQVVGEGSSVKLHPAQPPYSEASNAARILFDIPISTPLPYEAIGVIAIEFPANGVYQVDYENGYIYQADYNFVSDNAEFCIRSGQTTHDRIDGFVDYSSYGDNALRTVTPINFVNSAKRRVEAGDELTITSINGQTNSTPLGDLPKTFIVKDATASGDGLILVDFPEDVTSLLNIEFKVKSNHTVRIKYKYHPISIDIGQQVILDDGYSRGVRPGRGDYTIKNTPFVDIVSIEEIDPESGEVISEEPLSAARGYGTGLFSRGGYGRGQEGQYRLHIIAPEDRFSVFDAGLIAFGSGSLGKSYKVTYRTAPEIKAIHDLARNDLERVTGASVLPKLYAPAFVDIEVEVRRDPTNITVADDETLANRVIDLVEKTRPLSGAGIKSSDIVKILEDEGVDSVKTPFTMKAKVLTTDGSVRFFQNDDILRLPSEVLPKYTTNYVTDRISYFYANRIIVRTVTE